MRDPLSIHQGVGVRLAVSALAVVAIWLGVWWAL